MSGDLIQSDLSAAQATKDELTRSLDSYTSTKFSDTSSLSEGVPPTDHGIGAKSSESALQKYHEAIMRDAEAILSIAKNFEERDSALAAKLLSNFEVR